MKKYERILTLSEDTVRKVTQNSQNWEDYLKTSSRLYKYPFNDQLLIYAQCPEATACASFEIWNQNMNCRINHGAKGIALIDTDSEYPKLKYVFDIKDVNKKQGI